MAYIYIMTIEKFQNPIEIVDLFDAKLSQGNFAVAQKLIDIRVQSMCIAKQADNKLTEDGEFAKVYAESIAKWLVEIACVANQALEQAVEENRKFETCDICDEPDQSVVTLQLGDYGHESICEDCREDLLEKL
jgi:hypothetical protein